MGNNESSNKRIARNTAVLYIRMLIMMIISFFTARITLQALGVTDYGINNVVGGLVSMFSVLSGSLSTAASRFITFGLGEGNQDKLKRIFSATITIHLILSIIVVIAIESIGVWFLNHKMTIPADRLHAANWVLQCSVVSFVIGLLSVPYNSTIIAHEKMTAFAYMTIFDAVARLGIILGIYYYGGDRLILLSILTLIIGVIRQSIYWIYCKYNFSECKYTLAWDKNLGKSIFSFAGWNFIGCISGTLKDQGVNIAINYFTSPAVNAARGIALQVSNILGQFTGGFMTALNPQITKSYAIGDLERMHLLICQGTRFTYYLYMLLSIPVFFEIDTILYIWLGQVPEHTTLFVRLILVLSLLDITSYMQTTAQLATGKIRNFQLVVGGIQMLHFPISYVLLKNGFFPEVTIVVSIVISPIFLLSQLLFTSKSIKFPINYFFSKIYLNVIVVTILACIPPMVCYYTITEPICNFLIVCLVSLCSSILIIYYVGCNHEERHKILLHLSILKRKLKL